jgi:hypothetical protein
MFSLPLEYRSDLLTLPCCTLQSHGTIHHPAQTTNSFLWIDGSLVRQRIFPPTNTPTNMLQVYEEAAREWMSAIWCSPLSGDPLACTFVKLAADAVEQYWPFIYIMYLHFTPQAGYSADPSTIRSFVFGDIHDQLRVMEDMAALFPMISRTLDISEGIRLLYEIIVSNESTIY